MDEVFPVVAGIALGLVTYVVRPIWLRFTLIGILGTGLGLIASWVSNELFVSRLFVLIDTAQVIVAAVLSGVLVRVWVRCRARIAGALK